MDRPICTAIFSGLVCLFTSIVGVAQQGNPQTRSPAPPSTNPDENRPTDQMPSSRSFPPITVNDLRNSDSTTTVQATAPVDNDPLQVTTGSFQRGQSQSSMPTLLPAESQGVPYSDQRTNPILDSQVQPSNYTLPVAEPTDLMPGHQGTRLAKDILRRFEIGNVADPLPGRPLRLEDALNESPPQLRKQMVKQYWRTYSAWASLINETGHRDWLRQIARPGNQLDASLLNGAQMAAENDLLQAEIRLGQAQAELQRFLPLSGSSDLLPLPTDSPLVQDYETQYDWYIENGQLPQGMKSIHQALPKLLTLIGQRAEAVQSSDSVNDLAIRSFASNQTTMPTLLQAAKQSHDNLDSFMQSIVDYNQSIAEYSLTIAPNFQTVNQIAGMLVAPDRSTDINRDNRTERIAQRDDSLLAPAAMAPHLNRPVRSVLDQPGQSIPTSSPRQPNNMQNYAGDSSVGPNSIQPAQFNSQGLEPRQLPVRSNPAQQPVMQPTLQPTQPNFSNPPTQQPGGSQFKLGG